jgi:hypothetical protein
MNRLIKPPKQIYTHHEVKLLVVGDSRVKRLEGF